MEPSNQSRPETQSDAVLIERVRRGEVQAYGLLVARYERVVLAAVLPVVRDPHAAQDVVQDAFVDCYLKLPALRDPSRFAGWLLKAAGRQAVHVARRGVRSRLRIESSGLSDDNAPAARDLAGLVLSDERERLLQAVRRLPAHERVAVSLRYFEGKGVHEIAQITARPVGTVTKQLTRAIQRLRSDLGPGAKKTNIDTRERTPCQTNASKPA